MKTKNEFILFFRFGTARGGKCSNSHAQKYDFFDEMNVFGSHSNSIPGSVQNQLGCAIDNCSDPYRIQKMNELRSDLPSGSVQNDARKR